MALPRIAIIIYTGFGHITTMAETIKVAIEFGVKTSEVQGDLKDSEGEPKDSNDDSKDSKGESKPTDVDTISKVKRAEADIYQVAETLSPEVLAKMHAPLKPNYPTATPDTLTQYNAFLFGIPTRFGNMPAQMKTFWDATGKLWVNGSLAGKYAGIFVSTASIGGGQEMTPLTFMSTLAHQGMIFVPLGYASGMAELLRQTQEVKKKEDKENKEQDDKKIPLREEEARGASPWGAGTFTTTNGERLPSKLELDIAKCQGRAFRDIVSKVKFT